MRPMKTGRLAEEYAIRTLIDDGYKLLAANYHSIYGEVDVIAADRETVCFVEVKARKLGAIVSGAQSVTPAKRQKLIKTALLYLQDTGCLLQPRFDVFIVTVENGNIISHEHMKGAFDGGNYA